MATSKATLQNSVAPIAQMEATFTAPLAPGSVLSTAEAPNVASRLMRTPTPTDNLLSSPPPTIKAPALKTPSDTPQLFLNTTTVMYSSDQIASATAEELRTMLGASMDECHKAKTAAAHHKFQYTLLAMESSESKKRMQVELEMLQKEIDVIQVLRSTSALATPAMSSHSAPVSNSPSDRIILKLKEDYRLLELENQTLRRRLSDAKTAIVNREDSLLEEIELLHDRIRDNRAHMSLYRRSGMLTDTPTISTLVSPGPLSAQPHVANTKAGRRGRVSRVPKTPMSDQAFAALLLADQVLNQEAATTPYTPIANQANHVDNRGPSLLHSAMPQNTSKLQGRPFFAVPLNPAHSRPVAPQTPLPRINQSSRRKSRDSTISASDLEHNADSSDDEEVALVVPIKTTPKTPVSSKYIMDALLTPTPSGSAGGTKLRVAAMSEKRKNVDGGSGDSKKPKVGEGVGLGIGGLGSASVSAKLGTFT